MSAADKPKRASWELPDAVWQRMKPLIPPKKGKESRPRTMDLKRLTDPGSHHRPDGRRICADDRRAPRSDHGPGGTHEL